VPRQRLVDGPAMAEVHSRLGEQFAGGLVNSGRPDQHVRVRDVEAA
jgi:hypothetical protein